MSKQKRDQGFGERMSDFQFVVVEEPGNKEAPVRRPQRPKKDK